VHAMTTTLAFAPPTFADDWSASLSPSFSLALSLSLSLALSLSAAFAGPCLATSNRKLTATAASPWPGRAGEPT